MNKRYSHHFNFTLFVLLFLVGCSNPEVETKKDRPFETEQLYKGYSTSGGYLCYLKISPGNKVIFTYQVNGNSMYGEHSGAIKPINDSTYRVNCRLTFGQFALKALNQDSLNIFVNPPTIIDKNSLKVQYENGELMTKRSIDKSGLAFAFDSNLFNKYTAAFILTDHLHPITGKALKIKTNFGSAYDFVEGDRIEFDLIISGDSLYTIKEDPAFQTGPFRLKKERR